MKKVLKWIATVLSIAVVVTVLYFVFAFLGNPVSGILLTISSNQYMKENFADTDFEITTRGYNFKTGSYYAKVKSPSSQDTHFTLYFDGLGRYTYDTYDSVTGLYNTISRLDDEYRKLVDSKLYEGNGALNCGIAFGELRIAGIYEVYTNTTEDGTTEHYTLDKEYGLDRSALKLDGEYDIRELGRECGRIILYIHDEEVSVNRLAELLLETKDYLDDNHIPFYAINFNLCAPRNEAGQMVGDEISVYDFLYSDIYEDGLVERVQENWDAVREHHAIQDAETAKLVAEYSKNQ